MSLPSGLEGLRQFVKWLGISGLVERLLGARKFSEERAHACKGQCRLERAVCFLVISKDLEFLGKMKAAAVERGWTIAEASVLGEALSVTGFEDFPVVVLDQLACEGTWEKYVSALASTAQGVWCPSCSIRKGPRAASRGAGQNTNSNVLGGASECVVRRFFMSAKAPCVILASTYGDEYLRREVVRLGGYDVLSKSAPQAVISRAIEFAWFWSQHSATIGKPGSSGFGLSPTQAQGSRH